MVLRGVVMRWTERKASYAHSYEKVKSSIINNIIFQCISKSLISSGVFGLKHIVKLR